MRWPPGPVSRSARISAGGAAPFSEIPKTSPPSLRGLQKLPLPSVTPPYEGSLLKAPFPNSLLPRTALSFPSPDTGGCRHAPSSTLGTEGYILPLRAQPLLLLPLSSGGALDPFGLPQRIITPALYTLPAHSRSGVGDLAGVTESQAPGVSALGRSLVSGCSWCGT